MKFLSIVLATSFISKAAANPSGAGACPAGEAAPGGPHLTGTPGLVGELSAGDYVVTVGGMPVAFDGTPIEAPLDFDIEVTAAGENGFRGILIRVGGTSGDQVTSSDLAAPAGACGDVGSATHSENSLKTVGTAAVSLDESATLDVDISIVLENEDGESVFYYSAFQVAAAADGEGAVTTPPSEGVPGEGATTTPPSEELPGEGTATVPPSEERPDAGTPTMPTDEEMPADGVPTMTPVAGISEEDPVMTPVAAPTSHARAMGGVAATLAGVVALLL